MTTEGTDEGQGHDPATSVDELVDEWVELALEAAHGDELGRMLRHWQAEELVWRRFHAAVQHVDALANPKGTDEAARGSAVVPPTATAKGAR